MRRRGIPCELCGILIYAPETLYCHRCNINLAISLDVTRSAIRSKKNNYNHSLEAVIEVLSSDEERKRDFNRKIEEAEFISDESDDDISDDCRDMDPRMESIDGIQGIFSYTYDPAARLLSRRFVKYVFDDADFSAIDNVDDVSDDESDYNEPLACPHRSTPKKNAINTKDRSKDSELSRAFMRYIQNIDDYAPSDVGEVSDVDSSDENYSDDESLHVRNRYSQRTQSDDPCYMCESKIAPDNETKARVQCKSCKGVYHRVCAMNYGGETICWRCTEEDLINDNELTQDEVESTNVLFDVFHIKKEDMSPNEESDEIPDDDEIGDDVIQDVSQVKQTMLEGWRKFFDENTVKYEADFIAATRVIEKASGFKTALESDLHKIFEYFTNEQLKAEEEEKKDGINGMKNFSLLENNMVSTTDSKMQWTTTISNDSTAASLKNQSDHVHMAKDGDSIVADTQSVGKSCDELLPHAHSTQNPNIPAMGSIVKYAPTSSKSKLYAAGSWSRTIEIIEIDLSSDEDDNDTMNEVVQNAVESTIPKPNSTASAEYLSAIDQVKIKLEVGVDHPNEETQTSSLSTGKMSEIISSSVKVKKRIVPTTITTGIKPESSEPRNSNTAPDTTIATKTKVLQYVLRSMR